MKSDSNFIVSDRPYILRISAQKGGVGKTTIAVNLSVALKLKGYSVLLVDADASNPSVGLHLGLENSTGGFIGLLKGKSDLEYTVITHGPTGLAVICSPISMQAFGMNEHEEEVAYNTIKKSNYDIVIVDTQPGYFPDVITRKIDHTLIVTNPDMPSYMSALRLSEYFYSRKVPNMLLVNRVSNKKYEINIKEIRETYEGEIAAIVPEDEIVPVSIASKIPAFLLSPKNRFSKAILDLAEKLIEKSRMPKAGDSAYITKTDKHKPGAGRKK